MREGRQEKLQRHCDKDGFNEEGGRIEKPVRMGVLNTHVYPAGEFGVGTWANLTDSFGHASDMLRIVDGSCRVSPEVARAIGTLIKSDAEVVRGMEVVSPKHRLRYLRVRLFMQVLQRRHTGLLSILWAGRKCANSWIRAVLNDLAWAAGVVPKWSEMSDAEDHVWIAYLFKFQVAALRTMWEGLVALSARIPEPSALPVPGQAIDAIWTCGECGGHRRSRE